MRRRRTPVPRHVRGDPWSIPNILKALRDMYLKAPRHPAWRSPWDRGHIQIDLPFKGRSRFVAIAERDDACTGRMTWRLVWDGNDSRPDKSAMPAPFEAKNTSIFAEHCASVAPMYSSTYSGNKG
jgi:hypothetical protein